MKMMTKILLINNDQNYIKKPIDTNKSSYINYQSVIEEKQKEVETNHQHISIKDFNPLNNNQINDVKEDHDDIIDRILYLIFQIYKYYQLNQ